MLPQPCCWRSRTPQRPPRNKSPLYRRPRQAVHPLPRRSSRRPRTLLAKLKHGGYTLYIRHTATDFSRDDVRSKSDDGCDNQRPLTEKGRDEARRMSSDIKRAGFPISEVLASPRCRAMEVAQLAFGKYQLAGEVRGGATTLQPVERY